MIGLFLCYRPSGLDKESRDVFADRAVNRLTLLPGQPADRVSTGSLVGLSVHHGSLPSGGVAQDGDRALLCSGSCWVESRATRLANPASILTAWRGLAHGEPPNFGGSFILAHCDDRARKLTVLTDRFGTVPVYYRRLGETLLVSSEIRLLVEPGRDIVNLDAVAEMMTVGYLSRPHTLVAGIQRLPAHHRLDFSDTGLRITPLPTPGYPRNRPVDDEAVAEYDALVQRSLSRYAAAAPRFSISLSGGLDSRLLCAAAQRAGMKLEAFTAMEDGSVDGRMAERTAKLLDVPIRVLRIEGEGVGDWFGKMVWFTEGRVLPNHMHYVAAAFGGHLPPGPQLHGMLGEAIFGGAFDAPSLIDASSDSVEAACRRYAKGLIYWHGDTMQATFAAELADRVAAALEASVSDIMERIGFSGRYEDMLDFKWRFRVEGFTIPCLLGQVLPWRDVVSPFLDKDVFDLGATMEAAGLLDRAAQIRWAENHMPIVTKIPRVKDGIVIPVREGLPLAHEQGMLRLRQRARLNDMLCLLSRGRINPPYGLSFPIYGQWYRRSRPVRDYVDGIVLSERCLDRGLWRPAGLKRLCHDLRTGRHVWNAVGTILLVELFIRQFLEETDRPTDPIVPLGIDP